MYFSSTPVLHVHALGNFPSLSWWSGCGQSSHNLLFTCHGLHRSSLVLASCPTLWPHHELITSTETGLKADICNCLLFLSRNDNDY